MKKIALFFTLFVAIAMLTACVNEEEATLQQEDNTNSNVAVNENVVQNLTEASKEAKEDFDNYRTIINSNDRSEDDCKSIKNDKYREKCLAIVYTQLAEDNIDASYCSKITIPDLQDECMMRVEELQNPETF